jgi:mannosyltransferase
MTGRNVPGESARSGGRASLATRLPVSGAGSNASSTRRDGDATGWGFERWTRPAVIATLVISIALRFLVRSPLWLDESQTVSIAHRSLPHLFKALREDGAPPLYYVLLHWWMEVFGTGSFAVRSLSGIFSVASLPVIAVVAKRYRILDGAQWPAVLLLATCPFAVRYATETRMYSLVLLLVLLAMIAFERVWSVGGWRWNIAAAVVTGALVLTQYWALFLVASTGAGILIAWRRGTPRAIRLMWPLAIGCLAFVPWLPSFAYQSAHTGAPWGAPPGIEVPLVALGTWVGTGLTSPALRLAYYLLIALALIGYARPGGGITFRRPVRRRPLLLLGIALVALLLGTVASEVSASAFSSRYTTIALAPLLLIAAAGFAALSQRMRAATLVVVCFCGVTSSALIPAQLRTQAAQVAAVLAAAGPHDLVVFCPDQLGPAVNRLVPHDGVQVVYPTFGSPAMVDWVDYAKRNKHANPIQFADTALRRANGHTIWLVYAVGYPTLAGGCSSLLATLTAARGTPLEALAPHTSFEVDTVAEFTPR